MFGKLKSFNNKRHVGATIIRPIADHNEVSYHLLEATVVHLYYTRGPPDSGGKPGAAGNSAPGGITGNGGNADVTINGVSLSGLSSTAKAIYNCIKTTPQSNEGLHIQDIASKLKVGDAEVLKGGEELLGHGMIFTTVDDYTWAILDM